MIAVEGGPEHNLIPRPVAQSASFALGFFVEHVTPVLEPILVMTVWAAAAVRPERESGVLGF